jgi:diguanylate cyclase (GGDEF)-like protein
LANAVGDYVLRTAAATLRRELRPYDLLGRVGGEEFAILLPNTSAEEAVNVAERLRLALAVAPMAVADAQLVVTASFGISDGLACALDVDSMLGQADTAMYESKRAGRNRTTRFDAGGALMAIQ